MRRQLEDIFRPVARVHRLGLLAALWIAPAACDLEDDRDICCEGLVMEYTYLPYGEEAFPQYIQSLRHYLFDEQGGYLGEVPPGRNIMRQPLSLEAGSYTMVSVGNVSEQTLCTCAPQQGLESFELEVQQHFEQQEEALCNGDQLYWGVKEFAVDETPGRQARQRMVTQMNNIHCHLEVKVVWNNMPEHIGDYLMELCGVPADYSLCPDRCMQVGKFVVPAHAGELRTHKLRVPLKSQELHAEFVTLRYTDEQIPVLKLWFGNKKVITDIDLARAFNQWGWKPDRLHVQKYRIQIRIFGNGTVEVTPWIDASVDDWEDGGTFG